MNANSKALTVVVGLGEVGKPLYTILQAAEPEAVGVDIDPVTIDAPVGVLHICFPFLEPERFQALAVDYVRKYRPEVVVINSTVLPGTTRAIEAQAGLPCVYSPVRGKHTKMVEDLKMYTKFVAGTDTSAVERVLAQWTAAGLRSESMATPEALELSKLLETTYFGLLIAWAQEMNRFSEALNADYLELGKFFREIGYLPKALFQPGIIGGHCVMPNIALLQQKFHSEFLEVIQSSNEQRKREMAAVGQEAAKERLQPLSLEEAAK